MISLITPLKFEHFCRKRSLDPPYEPGLAKFWGRFWAHFGPSGGPQSLCFSRCFLHSDGQPRNRGCAQKVRSPISLYRGSRGGPKVPKTGFWGGLADPPPKSARIGQNRPDFDPARGGRSRSRSWSLVIDFGARSRSSEVKKIVRGPIFRILVDHDDRRIFKKSVRWPIFRFFWIFRILRFLQNRSSWPIFEIFQNFRKFWILLTVVELEFDARFDDF